MQCEHDSRCGGYALAAGKAMEYRKQMSDEHCQRRSRDDPDETTSRSGQPLREHHGDETLEAITRKGQDRGLPVAGAQYVGGAGIA